MAKVKRRDWKDMVFEVGLDILPEDLELLTSEMDSDAFDDHFAHLVSAAHRRTEASLRHMTAEERRQMDEAKWSELNQWVNHAVYTIARRTGIPESRIMSMRWILSWKEAPQEDSGVKAKARLVVRGFTDPDLLQLRSESPTLSRFSRHMLLQLASSSKWHIEVADAKTAFLQGGKEEADRAVYVEPTAEVRRMLNLTREQILKLEGSVYGLVTAPRHWWKKVVRDLQSLGLRVHQLDQCVFLCFNPAGDLVGAVGVYVDDF